MSGALHDTAEEGFALAEVLVAFAILALVSLAMMRAFGGTAETLGRTAARDAQVDLAERVAALRGAERPLLPGERAGEEGAFAWRSSIEAVEGAGLPSPDGAPTLFRLTVAVAAKGRTATGEPLLTTLLPAPDADE